MAKKDINDKIANRVNQYRNFPGYKNKTEADLKKMAEEKVRIDILIDELDIPGQFDDDTEKKESILMARKYFKDYTFEFVSDKNTLKQLIFLEIVNKRLQKMLNEFYTDSKAVPVQMMEALHKNIMQITELKKTLGLSKADREQNSSDAFKTLDILKKKFKRWGDENNGSRTMVCPHCSKMVLLRIRTDMWEAQKHPYFKDRFLANEKLIELYKRNRLTKQELSVILETSEDYIDWIISKLAPNNIRDLNTLVESKAVKDEQL